MKDLNAKIDLTAETDEQKIERAAASIKDGLTTLQLLAWDDAETSTKIAALYRQAQELAQGALRRAAA